MPNEILKQYWGFSTFRPLQQDIINSILAKKDTLALLPTGGGKSICFQVPALMQDGICLVVSPLIALIKDQVQNLKNKGIPALAIYSGMSFLEAKKTLENAAYGNYKFLYVSPERLETKLFLEYLPALNISLLAIDEAHCISQWGYDFRPAYLRIANLRAEIPDVPILALTASATKNVQDDICEKLQPPKSPNGRLAANTWYVFQQSFARANLSYSVFKVASKQIKLLEIFKNVNGSGIVYCKSRKHTKDVADLLRLHNVNADFYHAGLTNQERTTKQENWIQNKTRIIVCTNAFGMGIDKPDVRVVVHYDVPDTLENYYQEAGRCGRDGKRGYAVLLYNTKELELLKQQVDTRYPSEEVVKKVYTALLNFLQIAAGGGEGESYDFDIATFSVAFKIDMLTIVYSIKVLEQEGILSFSETFFKPSTIVFTTDKDSLFDFENTNPNLEPIIKGLLRTYEGIFDYPTIISETQLSKFIKKEISYVKNGLQFLHQKGIINYALQKDAPQLFLIQNRMYADSFRINMAAYLIRKKEFEKRVDAMIGYINETDICRSVFIGNYFNDTKIESCKICDTCINAQLIKLSKHEFEIVSTNIFDLLKTGKQNLSHLTQNLSTTRKQKVLEVVNYLQAEGKLNMDEHGNLYV